MEAGPFDNLSPHRVIEAVERAYGMEISPNIQPFASYVNRVYGLGTDEFTFVAKFYRPGRWSREAIQEEHDFMADLAKAEFPVVAPLPGLSGATLHTLALTPDDGEGTSPTASHAVHPAHQACHFTLFPKRAGRLFEAEGDGDWTRLGALIGRLHLTGSQATAIHRHTLHPLRSGAVNLQELYDSQTVHPDLEDSFFDLCESLLEELTPSFDRFGAIRIHGDCHRGNILDRGEEGLLLIDFDDMMAGPAVQDLWLLLPDRLAECTRETDMLIEGYERFIPFDPRQWSLVEGLRFLRMIHHLAWCARQRNDRRFRDTFPDWGSKSFWIKELEDFRTQAGFMIR